MPRAGQRLPAVGYGNGLDDQAWAPALQVTEEVVPQLLSALQRAAVPAYAAGVCASRVYLGVHWPADVIAGWLFAEGWLRLVAPN